VFCSTPAVVPLKSGKAALAMNSIELWLTLLVWTVTVGLLFYSCWEFSRTDGTKSVPTKQLSRTRMWFEND
jgi:hypothetical protein